MTLWLAFLQQLSTHYITVNSLHTCWYPPPLVGGRWSIYT